MVNIDTGPVLLGMLLIGSVLVSIPMHLYIKRWWLAGMLTAFITVIAIFALDSISIGFFNEQLLSGVAPGLGISFTISYLIWGAFLIVRKKKIRD